MKKCLFLLIMCQCVAFCQLDEIGGMVSDAAPASSLGQLCSKAQSLNAALMISRAWRSLATQTLPCSKVFLPGGLLQAAAGAALTVSPDFTCPTYRQCFDVTTNPGASLVISGTAIQLNPVWFGADWTGMKDSLPAFNAAYESGDALYVPAGTYNLSGQFTISRRRTRVICANRNSILSYSGPQDIASLIAIEKGLYGIEVDDCSLKGNSHITKALFYSNQSAGNRVSGISCLSATQTRGSGPASCLYFFNGNTNTAEDIDASGQWITTGIVFEDEANSLIVRPKVEEIVNEGIKLFHGTGIVCSGNTVIGGTSEGNGTGQLLDNCGGNTVMGLDLESNHADFVDAGIDNHYINTGGGFTFNRPSANASLEAVVFGGYTINTGVRGTSITNSTYGGGPMIDNGTCSVFRHNRTVNGGHYFPDQEGCQNGVTFQQGFNRVVETASTPITAASCSANAITFTATGHLLSPGFMVTITGASPAAYNVSAVRVTAINENQFSVPASSCPGNYTGGGRIVGSADNALVGSFSAPGYIGARPAACPAALDRSNDGMLFYIELGHDLRDGSNTFNFCGLGAMKIIRASDGKDIAARKAGGGVTLSLRFVNQARAFVDLAQ